MMSDDFRDAFEKQAALPLLLGKGLLSTGKLIGKGVMGTGRWISKAPISRSLGIGAGMSEGKAVINKARDFGRASRGTMTNQNFYTTRMPNTFRR